MFCIDAEDHHDNVVPRHIDLGCECHGDCEEAGRLGGVGGGEWEEGSGRVWA